MNIDKNISDEILQVYNIDKLIENGEIKTVNINDIFTIKVDGCEINTDIRLKIDIFLDATCNANCPFCINKGKSGQTNSLYTNKLPYEEFVKRFDSLYDEINSQSICKPFLMFTGGEPTISPFFIPMINHLFERKIQFDLLTNGSNLLSKHNDIPLIKIMAKNCGGMHISRAHYDDNKNKELMNLSKDFTNNDLDNIFKYIKSDFYGPYEVSLSCMMMKNGIHTVNDVKQYIETYSKYDNVLHSIVFREMEDISELNDVNVENILFRYKDIENDLKNDKDFKLIDSVTKYDLEYYNHIYQYKDCNIPIIFTQPPEFKTKHNKITPFITLYPDGKVYKEYFTKLN